MGKKKEEYGKRREKEREKSRKDIREGKKR